MSEPVAKQRTMIDLDEFERRLRRPAASPQGGEDPLAELARLVGSEQDPYQGVFQEPSQQRSQSQGRPQARQQPELRATRPDPQPVLSAAKSGLYAERPAFQQPAARMGHAAMPIHGRGAETGQGLGGNFAAIEAGLRGSLQPDYRTAAPESYAQQYQSPDPQMEDDDDWLDEAQAPEPAAFGTEFAEAPRSRRLLFVTAAIIVVGISGIGATFALKRTPAGPQQIAMIKATTRPAKVAAPPQIQSASAKAAIQDASVLDTTPQPAPVGVINRTEEPVDLPHAAGVRLAADVGNAQSVPVPVPPSVAATPDSGHAQSGQARAPGTQVASTSNEAFGLGGMIQPRKVKTVTVRPDGTVVADDAAAPMPPDSTAATPLAAAAAAAGEDTASTGALPQTSANGGEAAAALPMAAEEPPPPSHSSRAHAKPVRVANLAHDDANGVAETRASGSFAVQLAARATESEAHQALTQLARKYSSVLGTKHLKFRRAKVGGKSVFRVRVGSLSKDAAAKLCTALQGKGGSCFVARD